MKGERVILEGRGAVDLRASWAPLHAGLGDPTMRLAPARVVRATRTPEGPASFELRSERDDAIVSAYGAGAGWVLERASDLSGCAAEPPELPASAPLALRQMRARAAGVRLVRTHRVVEALIVLVLQQLVRGKEAGRAHRNLLDALGEPAPGPFEGLLLPLRVEQLRALRPGAVLAAGVLRKQALSLRELGFHADALEACTQLSAAEADARVQAVRGLGPWTAGSLSLRALGAPDAVIVGDYHLPRFVAHNLGAREDAVEAADDGRMLELLEPYRGMRGWVTRWIAAAGRPLPRRGPRRTLRRIPGDRRG